MLTASTFVHAQNTSTFAFQFLVRLLRILLRNALQTHATPFNQYNICDFLDLRKRASSYRIKVFSDSAQKHAFHNLRFRTHTHTNTLIANYRLCCTHAVFEMYLRLMVFGRNHVLPRGVWRRLSTNALREPK